MTLRLGSILRMELNENVKKKLEQFPRKLPILDSMETRICKKECCVFGSIFFVCVAEYGKQFKGYVKVDDRDTFVDNAT